VSSSGDAGRQQFLVSSPSAEVCRRSTFSRRSSRNNVVIGPEHAWLVSSQPQARPGARGAGTTGDARAAWPRSASSGSRPGMPRDVHGRETESSSTSRASGANVRQRRADAMRQPCVRARARLPTTCRLAVAATAPCAAKHIYFRICRASPQPRGAQRLSASFRWARPELCRQTARRASCSPSIVCHRPTTALELPRAGAGSELYEERSSSSRGVALWLGGDSHAR